MSEAAFSRHDLAFLAHDAAARAIPLDRCTAAVPNALGILSKWVRDGHPLVVTRQPDAPLDVIHLGLPLPPSRGKLRLAFAVALRDITAHRPAPTLESALDHLPLAWRPALTALCRAPSLAPCSPRIFGSAAIQAVTGMEAVHADSDLDLLLAPQSWDEACAAVRFLTEHAQRHPSPRIDGELLTRSGAAVSWRELASASRMLLLKNLRDLGLIEREGIVAAFDRPPRQDTA